MARPHNRQLSCKDETHFDPAQARQDNQVILLIHGLNDLIAKANRLRMGTAAKILYFAKEELVHWAVEMNFHETAKDRFINYHLYNLSSLGKLIAQLRESDEAREMQQDPDAAAVVTE